ncbi:Down syndrome cell adhesion molecule [Nymphon striatum]|nr:Down syndrome cell adhesion molecule [Nymphon striatum]
MIITKKKEAEIPTCKITVNGINLKQAKSFKYLGTTINWDAKDEKELNIRIAQAKAAFQQMKAILCYKNISLKTRYRVLNCYIYPIFQYNSETWNISKPMADKINAFEMWGFRRIQRISWKARKTNEEVLRQTNQERCMLKKIKQRQYKFMGHVLRKQQLENLSLSGKINGKRTPGTQRKTFLKQFNADKAERIFTTHMIEKYASPSWIIKPKHQTAAVNQNVFMNCQSTAHPAPSLVWKRRLDNRLVDITDNGRVRVAMNGTLIIKNVAIEDNGFYVCEISNDIPPPLSEEISFTVGYPPKFKKLSKSIRGQLGRQTALQCEVFGNYPLKIKWFKDFEDLSVDNRYGMVTSPNVDGIGKVSNLNINSVKRSDGGRYNCEASNIFGKSSSEVSMVVEESPGKVNDLRIFGFQNRSILVTWTYPTFDGNSPVTNFIVEYSQLADDTPSGHRISRLNGSSRSYLFKDIEPSKHYVLQITAENLVGISESSTQLPFILSRNGTIILPRDSPGEPPFHWANYIVLLVLAGAITFILIFTAIFIVIYIIKKKKRGRISRPTGNDRVDRQLYDKCKSKDAAMMNELKDKQFERYGRLLPPPSIEHEPCYADSQTYKAKDSSMHVKRRTLSHEDLQRMVQQLCKVCKDYGMSLHAKKIKVMTVSKTKMDEQLNIYAEQELMETVKQYKYLGTWITEDGKCISEVKRRITKAKDDFWKYGLVSLLNQPASDSSTTKRMKFIALTVLKTTILKLDSTKFKMATIEICK